MNIAIVSSSLNPGSRSRLMAKSLVESYGSEEGVEIDFIDLQENKLPLCDGGAAYGDPVAQLVTERMGKADAYVIATPIYNYSINAALKNLTEFAGRQMEGKLVGFLCAAGGAMSYMAIMTYANSLMLDFRTLILPRVVYANSEDWDGDALGEGLQGRLDQFQGDFLSLARKLRD